MRDTLRLWDLELLVDAASLVVSELVTNAVLHARSAITVALCAEHDGSLRLEVSDLSARAPQRRGYGPGATTGRGLGIVAELVDDWGVRPTSSGKSVWAVLHPYGDESRSTSGTASRAAGQGRRRRTVPGAGPTMQVA